MLQYAREKDNCRICNRCSKPDYSLLLIQSSTLSPLEKVTKTATCYLASKSVHPSLAEKNYYYSALKDEM